MLLALALSAVLTAAPDEIPSDAPQVVTPLSPRADRGWPPWTLPVGQTLVGAITATAATGLSEFVYESLAQPTVCLFGGPTPSDNVGSVIPQGGCGRKPVDGWWAIVAVEPPVFATLSAWMLGRALDSQSDQRLELGAAAAFLTNSAVLGGAAALNALAGNQGTRFTVGAGIGSIALMLALPILDAVAAVWAMRHWARPRSSALKP